MSKSTPRAYSYLRFSSPEQLKGDSLRRQTALAGEYATRHGLTLDTELNLRDMGVSAFRGDNVATGALGAFLQALRDGLVPRGSYLLVESLDRVSRKQALKAINILGEICEAGVIVVTLNDGKQYTEENMGGMDALIAFVILMRAHEESLTKSKRVKAAWVGKREHAARREVITTIVPAWIKTEGSGAKHARNAKLSLIPERAKLIRRLFSMFLAGQGKESIAKTFNAEQVPTWGAGKGRKPATHWHRSYVMKLLTNPAVTGRFTPHVDRHENGRVYRDPQAPVADYYPRVIDDETFERVQGLIGARKDSVRSAHVASLVAGLAKCPKCGSTMTRISKGSRKKGGPPKLVCTKAKAGNGCAYKMVRLADVERALIGNAALLAKPPVVDTDFAEQLEDAEREVLRLAEQVESIVDAIEHKSSDALRQRLTKRESSLELARDHLKALKTRAAEASSNVVAHRARRLSEALSALDGGTGREARVAAANAALRECVSTVTVDYAGGELRLMWRHGGEPTRVQFAWPDSLDETV